MASERPPRPPLPTAPAPAPAIPPTPIFHISAEDHRLFLLLVLQTWWRQKMKVGGFYDQISQLPTGQEKGGLYFIFGFPEKPDDDPNMIYPLYIGITGQDFETRFSKHKTVKLGEWKTFQTSPQKGEVNLKQKAFVVNMPLPAAKFFESVFLSTFDFPMNEQENNKKRDIIWTGKPQEVNAGRKLFRETLQDNFLKLENAAKLVLQDTTQILNPEFTTAIFKKWNKGGLSNLFAGLKI